MKITLDETELRPVIERVVRETIRQIDAERGAAGERLLFTRVEAAALLGVEPATIGMLERSGELIGVRVGKGQRYTRAELERLIAAKSGEGYRRRA